MKDWQQKKAEKKFKRVDIVNDLGFKRKLGI